MLIVFATVRESPTLILDETVSAPTVAELVIIFLRTAFVFGAIRFPPRVKSVPNVRYPEHEIAPANTLPVEMGPADRLPPNVAGPDRTLPYIVVVVPGKRV